MLVFVIYLDPGIDPNVRLLHKTFPTMEKLYYYTHCSYPIRHRN